VDFEATAIWFRPTIFKRTDRLGLELGHFRTRKICKLKNYTVSPYKNSVNYGNDYGANLKNCGLPNYCGLLAIGNWGIAGRVAHLSLYLQILHRLYNRGQINRDISDFH